MPIEHYQGKTVWVTGASSGIGRALSQSLSKQGAYVILSARSMDKLQVTQQSLKYPNHSKIVILDMSDPVTIKAKTQEILADFPKIDLLINNAGISQRSLAIDTQIEVCRRLMETNFFGVIDLSKRVLPAMIARGEGQIATISSVNGKLGSYMKSGYAASKHALHGYFDSLRAEISDTGVIITMVTPGYVQSNISMNALTADGNQLNSMDDNTNEGIPADTFADKALKQIAKGKNEIAIAGNIETLGLWLKRLAPNLLFKLASSRKEA